MVAHAHVSISGLHVVEAQSVLVCLQRKCFPPALFVLNVGALFAPLLP